MPQVTEKSDCVKFINIRGLDFSVGGELGELPEFLKLDTNMDGYVDNFDDEAASGCNEMCRVKTFLGIHSPLWKNDAEFFADLAEAAFNAKFIRTSIFCQRAITENIDDLDLSRPLPCCIPIDFSAIAYAESIVVAFAEKYNWPINYVLLGVRDDPGNVRSWRWDSVYVEPLSPDARRIENIRFVPCIKVPVDEVARKPAYGLIGPLLSDLAEDWNMVAAFMADARFFSKCSAVDMHVNSGFDQWMGSVGAVRSDSGNAKQKLKPRKSGGFTLPIFIDR